MARDEHSIQKACLDYLKLRKHFHWRNNTGVAKTGNRFIRYGEVGSPDIFVVVDGFLIGLEIKDPKGKQTPEQKDWEKRLKEAGGEYYVITDVLQLKEYGL